MIATSGGWENQSGWEQNMMAVHQLLEAYKKPSVEPNASFHHPSPSISTEATTNMSRPVTTNEIQRARVFIKDVFGYHIQNSDLIYEAIDATGLNEHFSIEKNKRLAMIGDKVLDLAIITNWYPTQARCGKYTSPALHTELATDQCVGVVSNMMQRRVNNDNLASVARRIRLDTILVPHPGQGMVNDKAMSTGIEAVFGAIYQDEPDPGKKLSMVKRAMRSVGI